MCLGSFVIVANKFNVVRIYTSVSSSPINSGGVDVSGDSDDDDNEEEKEEYILKKGIKRRTRRRRRRKRRIF